MRMTGSRAYSRPTPVPKMPPGLVDLMEGLSKEVLRNNPSDVYGFCAMHMQKLLEIRDGPIAKKKQSLSLDQKIANAQEKVRQRAESRRQKYDDEAKLQCCKKVDDNLLPDEKNAHLSEDQTLIQNTPKAPVYHELLLADASEIEISQESASNCVGTDIVKLDEQNDDFKELASETETVIDDKKKINGVVNKITLSNIANTNDVILIDILQEKGIDSDDSNNTVEPYTEFVVGQNGTEFTVAQKDTVKIDTSVQNMNTNSDDHKLSKDDTVRNDSEVVSEPDCLIDVIEDTAEKATLSSSDVKNSEMSKKEEIYVKGDEKNNIKPINIQSIHVEAELHQVIDSYNMVLDSIKNAKMEQDRHIIVESNTTEPNISKGQEKEKFDVMVGQNQIEKVMNDIEINDKAVDTKAVLKSENGNLPDKIYEEHQNNTEKSNEITNDSQNPIEVVEKAENQLLETASAIDMSITILTSVAGDEPKCQVDNTNRNNQTIPEIPDDSNLVNVEALTSIHEEIMVTKDIQNNEDTNAEMYGIDLNDETVVEKSNMGDNNESGSSIIITEDIPKIRDMIRNDVHESSNMDIETAAITIQKVFRTFLFKSRASTFEDSVNNEASSMEEDNENKDECHYPITSPLKDRRLLGITRMDTVLQTVNEEKSLSLSTDDSSTLSSAATIIQAHVRGYLVRNKLNSNKTDSSNSMLNSDGRTNSTLLDNDNNLQKKTVLNIHIVPEGGNFSRDESIITSIELSLDGSPPSSINLHPLGYDISERRKQLKREDAFQSISPPSNNSGKLSEEVDSVIEQCVADGNDSQQKNNLTDTTDVEVRANTVAENATNESVSNVDNVCHEQTEEEMINKRKSLQKMSSDEMDVVTPFGESAQTNVSHSENSPNLLHSGEMHDIALPTKVSRSDTSVVRGGPYIPSSEFCGLAVAASEESIPRLNYMIAASYYYELLETFGNLMLFLPFNNFLHNHYSKRAVVNMNYSFAQQRLNGGFLSNRTDKAA